MTDLSFRSVGENTLGRNKTFWYSRSSVPTPLGIAAQLGWFEEISAQGIELRSLQDHPDAHTRKAHINHQFANTFRQGGSVPALWARSAGADTRLIGLTWTDEFQVVLVRENSLIRKPRDLRGRRLGLPLRSYESIDMARATALRAYLTLLEHEGLSYRDVELVDVEALPYSIAQDSHALVNQPAGHLTNRDYAADINALLNGEVDAIYVKGVRGVEVARIFSAETRIVADIGGHADMRVRSNNSAPRPITVNAAVLRHAPEVATQLLERIIAVGNWAEAHPQETIEVLSRETGSRSEWVQYAYGVDIHRHLHTDLAEYSINALDDFKNFLFQWGFLPENFSIRTWIDSMPLLSLNANNLQRVFK